MCVVCVKCVCVCVADRDSTIETGVMGVGEGSVCASVQNMGGGGGYNSQAEFDCFVNS